jgi:hypothetical protein
MVGLSCEGVCIGEVRGSNPADSHIFYTTTINQSTSDTWHPWIGPRVLISLATQMTRVTSRFVNHQPIKKFPRHHCTVVRSCHVRPYGLYGLVQSASNFFACLAWRTDRDIFSIRSPFDKVNIPPESGRRDGRNGTVFVAFRAL